MTAYFSEGEDIGETETLARLAAEAGLDADEVRAALDGDAYTDAVRADERRARILASAASPSSSWMSVMGYSGAQPTELFLQVLEETWAESHPLLKVTGASADADVCEGDNCALPAEASAVDQEA